MTAGPIQLDPFDSTDGGEGGETSWGVVVDDRLVGLVVIDPSNPSLTAAGYDHDPAVCELGVLLSAEATAGHPGLELAVWQHVHTMLTELADRPVFVAVSAGAVATVASLRRLAWREIGPAAWLGTDGEPAGELLFFQQPAVRELAA